MKQPKEKQLEKQTKKEPKKKASPSSTTSLSLERTLSHSFLWKRNKSSYISQSRLRITKETRYLRSFKVYQTGSSLNSSPSQTALGLNRRQI